MLFLLLLALDANIISTSGGGGLGSSSFFKFPCLTTQLCTPTCTTNCFAVSVIAVLLAESMHTHMHEADSQVTCTTPYTYAQQSLNGEKTEISIAPG